ncbi:NUDIX hydrolase [Shimia sagamensis]|uniref:8-oxo-dGTP pyrophosphatase MutT, NUDIX family n=1 Tax=Shimia sagamensis TaxID=1566352 RepID=A0ABY1P4E8_9RHOB|nr:NUDIX hydrolase [Shimia sagamensis]SMP25255.1 8-oxo-dGTP pyrophosphatase MutT, NUDIX family [Shimia sagamensis]
MTNALKTAFDSVIAPMLRRPRRIQVAALCTREKMGATEVLLITSRDTGRWVLPKGWPINGLDAPGAALREAWEEAGVKEANINSEPVGIYGYAKRLDGGLEVPVDVTVFETEVKQLVDDFPEAEERTRKWVPAQEAAGMVNEPQLQAILREM